MGDSPVSPIRSVRTICPFCSCGCGLYLTGTSHDIEGVGPSEHHPVSQGRLCARGWAAHEAAQWGPRVRAPLVRRGGELQPATWQEALAIAVAGLERLRDAGRAVGVLSSGRATNEESFLALALARSALRTPHVDAPLRRQWDVLVRGLGHATGRPSTGVLERLEHSDVVVVVEDDLSVTHPRVALAVMRAVRRGAKLVALGWQRTPLAALATAHVALDSSAPLAALAGLRASGDLEAAQRASFVIAPFVADPAALQDAAGVLAELALGMAEGGRQQPLLLPLPVRANTRGALDMGVAPDRLTAGRLLDDADARASLRRLWAGAGCWDAGADADEMAGAVAGLVVLGEDLPAVHPAPAEARRQLGALEHLVVIDSFLTETAAAATVVLPMAAFGEAEGSLTGLEDRAQAVTPFLAPPDGVRQGWEILADLLGALGAAWRPRSLADVRAAIASCVPGYGALGETASADSWAVTWAAGESLTADGAGVPEPAAVVAGPPEVTASPRRMRLRRVGAFDWGRDPLVRFSPTLRRIPASVARRYPHGLVTISAADAKTLGVREGWTVRITGPAGEARPAVTVSAGLQDGLLLVPYAFREQLAGILAVDGVAEVEVQPA